MLINMYNVKLIFTRRRIEKRRAPRNILDKKKKKKKKRKQEDIAKRFRDIELLFNRININYN